MKGFWLRIFKEDCKIMKKKLQKNNIYNKTREHSFK